MWLKKIWNKYTSTAKKIDDYYARIDSGIERINVKVKKVREEAIIPKYATDGSAAFDLHAPDDFVVDGRSNKIPLGLAFEVPKGYAMLIAPRSSIGLKTPLRQSNSVGVIDSDYRGEVSALYDVGEGEVYQIQAGDRIAQAFLVKVPEVNLIEVDELSETERGVGGFGSTGS